MKKLSNVILDELFSKDELKGIDEAELEEYLSDVMVDIIKSNISDTSEIVKIMENKIKEYINNHKEE